MITLIAVLTAGCGNAQSSNANQQAIKTVGVADFAKTIEQKHVRLIDVRTAKEYAEGHIAGAELIDVRAADFAKRTIGIKGTVAVFCRSGKRSLMAAELLAKQGCTVYNLDGGILAWQKAGKPITKVETDIFATRSGRLVKIHALMHSCIRIEYNGHEIEIDPCAKLNSRTVDYSAMPKADIILVTHEHFDHYDSATISLLSTGKTQLIMNKRCADLYGKGTVMKNGDRKQLADDITIEAVAAYNTTKGHRDFHPKGRDNGYILTLDGLRIYIAGDTEDIPEMAKIKDIDIAFLPCNQPYTMTPDQLAKAAKTIKPKTLFPYHYGETNVSGIPAQLKAIGIDVRIRHYE